MIIGPADAVAIALVIRYDLPTKNRLDFPLIRQMTAAVMARIVPATRLWGPKFLVRTNF
jgi:hypothetical protein